MSDIFIEGTTGNKLYVRKSGLNKKGQVLLLHGFGLNSSSWRGVERYLAREYECFSVDIRGHGNSTNNSLNISLDDLTSDCYKILTDLNIVNPIFVGHSLGGVIVLNMMKNTKVGDSKIVLISVPYKSPFCEMTDVPLFHSLKYRLMFLGSGAYYFYTFAQKFLEKKGSEGADIWKFLRKTDPVCVMKIIWSLRDYDFTSFLPEIKNKVLLIYGQKDPLIPENERLEISYKIRNSKLFIIRDVMHAPQFEKPKTVVEEIIKFLDGTK